MKKGAFVIDAVLLFGAINIIFEMVLLSMIPPRRRLRMLGSEAASNALHAAFLMANLAIHWGTLVGTMSGVLAFVASVVTVRFARKLFGRIAEGRYYHVGWIKYPVELIK